MALSSQKIDSFIWGESSRGNSSLKRYMVRLLRIFYALGRDILQGQLTLRASSLSYTTLLSLVPFLAVSFSVLQAFGVYNQLEPLLLQFLEPLGPKGVEVANNIIVFVGNMKVGVLGSVGLAMLFYTVISLVNKIEKSFNFTWRVKENRSFGRRFSDYLSVILIGPVLMFSAVGLSTSLMSTTVVQQILTMEPFGSVLYFAGKTTPKLLTILAFAFIYVLIPNTKVKLSAALGGALFAGILWQLSGWGFTSFVASSTNYAAIYSSFAILITFFIWLYLNWLIVLIGAQTAYYIQNPGVIRKEVGSEGCGGPPREQLALLAMALVADNFYRNTPPWTTERLSSVLGVSETWLNGVLQQLEKHRLLTVCAGEPAGWLPARDIETIRLDEIVFPFRGEMALFQSIELRTPVVHHVEKTVENINLLLKNCLSEKNIKALVVESRYGKEG